jgi:hypothetical protein
MTAIAATLLWVAAQEEASQLLQELEIANSKDRPQLQGQAVKRLQARGAQAVAGPIAGFVKERGHAALSVAFTEGLGALKHPVIRTLLTELFEDPKFFWRPAALRALADHGDPSSKALFRKGLEDRLWGCRAAAVLGLERLGDRDSAPRIKERLGDEAYEVRAQAARTLHAFGDPSGLPVLVEALRADSVWFDIDYGQIAREDAWNFLKKVAGNDFGYKPWETAEQRAPGLAKFEAWIARTMPDWREKVPDKARSIMERPEWIYGYELRSCQRGDVFFRIDAQGNLVLGYFTMERAKLEAGEFQALLGALETVKGVDRRTAYGEGGCDYEQHFLKVGGRFEKLWIGQKGRPAAVEPFIAKVRATLGKHFGERTLAEYQDAAILFQVPE